MDAYVNGEQIVYCVERLRRLPLNAAAFVEELANGIGCLYGPEAVTYYRATGTRVLQSAFDSGDVEVIGVQDGRHTAGILLAYVRHRMGYISLLHVLNQYEHRQLEHRLVREAVRMLRAMGVDGIVHECLAFGALDLDETFASLDFEPVDRAIMTTSLCDRDWTPYHPDTAEAGAESFHDLAETIVNAYAEHPGRRLHIEVCQPAYAVDFLQRVVEEDYGYFRPGYMRAAREAEKCVGVGVGCEAAPGYGFVLQVAVHRDSRRKGVGTALVRDLMHEFWRAGMRHVALGVTLGDPAQTLYERLGFTVARPVRVYAWQRPARIQCKGVVSP